MPEYGIDDGVLWRHSVAAALAAELERLSCTVKVPPEAFTAALLHDVGKLVLCRHMKPEVLELLARAQAQVVLEAVVDRGFSNGGGGDESLAQPAIADLDGDGSLEIVISSNILQSNGVQIFSDTSLINAKSAAIGRVDDDPTTLEIVLGEQGWRFDTTTKSFVDLGAVPTLPRLASAIIGDCGDGHRDVVAGDRNSSGMPTITAYHATGAEAGELFSGYPKSIFGKTGDVSAPVIGDFNGDGRVQVATTFTDASYGGLVAIWDMDGENNDEHHDWPMLGHNVRRSGTYADPTPNRPADLTQETIDGSLILNWTDRSDVEDHYVIQRSSTGDPWSYDTFAILPADSTQFVLGETQPGFFRVRALRFDARTGDSILSRFAVEAVTDTGPSIPTLGTWGLAVMVLLLGIAATVMIRRKPA